MHRFSSISISKYCKHFFVQTQLSYFKKSKCLAAFYDATGAVFYNVTAAMFLDITAVVFEDVTLTLYYAVRGFSCRVTQTHFQQECLNYPLMFEDSLMKRWNFG